MCIDTLQQFILSDMMASMTSSSLCSAPQGTTVSNFTYSSSQNESQWYNNSPEGPFSPLEQYVFQTKMSHFDSNPNRTWTIRLGTGGNIYSMVGPMGETVPPQWRNDSPWIDEVWQTVAVDRQKNQNSPFFIHEAGSYQSDKSYNSSIGVPLTDIPFYAPHLGSYCDDDEGVCTFASWVSFCLIKNYVGALSFYCSYY